MRVNIGNCVCHLFTHEVKSYFRRGFIFNRQKKPSRSQTFIYQITHTNFRFLHNFFHSEWFLPQKFQLFLYQIFFEFRIEFYSDSLKWVKQHYMISTKMLKSRHTKLCKSPFTVPYPVLHWVCKALSHPIFTVRICIACQCERAV